MNLLFLILKTFDDEFYKTLFCRSGLPYGSVMPGEALCVVPCAGHAADSRNHC
ncbi:MAG TPA: hypothetical protein VIH86_10865 [Puia sp.]